MLIAKDLSCIRGGLRLFSELTFSVPAGSALHVVGINGSGKTSLLRILTGLSFAETGTVNWQGFDTIEHRELFHQALLYIGHQPGLRQRLSVNENLQLLRPELSTAKQQALLVKVGLGGYDSAMAWQLSAGQQKRLGFCRMVDNPKKLWILDEPATALDVRGVEFLQQQISQHVAQEGTVIFTSHQVLSFSSTHADTLNLDEYLDY